MLEVDLMLPATVPPAMADAAADRAGVRRDVSRLATVRHEDGQRIRTYIVPLALTPGTTVDVTVAGVTLALSAHADRLSVTVRPKATTGLLVSALAAWVTDRESGLDLAFDVPIDPGANHYVDLPIVGQCGVRVPRAPLALNGD